VQLVPECAVFRECFIEDHIKVSDIAFKFDRFVDKLS
jgi:hypothetical protein